MGERQIKEDIGILYVPSKQQKVLEKFRKERRKTTLFIIGTGVLMAGMMYIHQYGNEALKEEPDSLVMLILFVVAAVLAYEGKGRELHQRVEKRNDLLQKAYPEIVSKLALLTGAGMTLRGAFMKLASDYRRKRAEKFCCVYEEIMYMCNEMETGVAEAEAYINWGKRCRIREYNRLSMLLVQNLKKGSYRLTESLREEASLAFAARKEEARRAGEIAGTKLLLPMGLMLMIVMVIILVPAFSMFG